MSQIEMKELKDWLNDPTALKFKKILVNSRTELLNYIADNYIGQGAIFNKDFVLSSLGGCKALEQVANYLGLQNEEGLADLLKRFYGGENE